MPTRIRLQRYGKKHKPFYHIVIADGRAPRDGRFIETIGTYNPLTNPADVVLDFDKALDWLQKGAEPSDTARSILSYKGVIYKNHLLKGVKKGAMTEEQAEAKFNIWLKEKNEKIEKKVADVQLGIRDLKKARHTEETKINETRANLIAKKKADELEKQVEKTKGEITAEVPEGQEDEVRTPKQVELKKAIEEKAELKEKAEVKEEVTEAAAVKSEEKKEEKVEEKKEEVKKEEAVAEAVAEKKEEDKKEAGAEAAAEKKEEKVEEKKEEDKKEEKE